MNCELCKQELEAYHEGKLHEGIRVQVKEHLQNCTDCAKVFYLEHLAERVIKEEKELQSNSFLSTRIMAGIEELGKKDGYTYIPGYQKVLKPAIITISVAAAIFIGVMAGNIYKPDNPKNGAPIELSYINDAALESVELLATK